MFRLAWLLLFLIPALAAAQTPPILSDTVTGGLIIPATNVHDAVVKDGHVYFAAESSSGSGGLFRLENETTATRLARFSAPCLSFGRVNDSLFVGLAGGGRILKSTSGGASWDTCFRPGGVANTYRIVGRPGGALWILTGDSYGDIFKANYRYDTGGTVVPVTSVNDAVAKDGIVYFAADSAGGSGGLFRLDGDTSYTRLGRFNASCLSFGQINDSLFVGLAGGGRVLKSTSGGASWDTCFRPSGVANTYRIVERPGGVLWILTGDSYGDIFEANYKYAVGGTVLAGATWVHDVLPWRGELWAASGTDSGRIWRSTDAGVSWSQRSSVPARNALSLLPISENIYAGTDSSAHIFVSYDAGTSWRATYAPDSANSVYRLILRSSTNSSRIVAATGDQYGNVYESDVGVAPEFSIVGVVAPDSVIPVGVGVVPRVSIRNLGLSRGNGVVRLKIHDVYLDSATITGLGPGQTDTVSLPQWIPLEAAAYITECTTFVVGGAGGANRVGFVAVSSGAGPEIHGREPTEGVNTGPLVVNITGLRFQPGMAASLRLSGFPDIVADSVEFVSAQEVNATFDLTGAAAGDWDLKVTIPNGDTYCFHQGFRIVNYQGRLVNFGEWSDFGVPAGDSVELGVIVPSGQSDLFVLLKKSVHVGHHSTWPGDIRVMKGVAQVASSSGEIDYGIHIKMPSSGLYILKIRNTDYGVQGLGRIRVSGTLDTLVLDAWKMGQVLRGWGNDWQQLDVPSGATALYVQTEGFGIHSALDVYRDSLGSTTQHWHVDENYRLQCRVPNPPAGRYYVKYMDSDNVVGDTSQVRDYLIRASTDSVVQPPPPGLTITSLSTYRGGTAGPVTVIVHGTGFDSSTAVLMTREGEPDQVPTTVRADTVRRNLRATFDLSQAAQGEWSFMLRNPSGDSAVAPRQFSVVNGGSPELVVEFIGRSTLRAGRRTVQYFRIANAGSIDADPLMAAFFLPPQLSYVGAESDDPLLLIPVDTASGFLVTDDENDRAVLVVLAALPAAAWWTVGIVTYGAGAAASVTAICKAAVGAAAFNFFANLIEIKAEEQGYPLTVPERSYLYGVAFPALGKTIYEMIGTGGHAVTTTLELMTGQLANNLLALAIHPWVVVARGLWAKWQVLSSHSNWPQLLLRNVNDLLMEPVYWGREIWRFIWRIVTSSTPEDKFGPAGLDLAGTPVDSLVRFVSSDQLFPYRIDFWNAETASAPAQDVFVKDTLSSRFDDTTFNFTEFGFMRWRVAVSGGNYFNSYVDMRPDDSLIVNVEGSYNQNTREVNWTFRSLDPVTMQTPDDPMAGFLPPIDSTGFQIGWVNYDVKPRAGLLTGTQVANQAYVKFDVGPWKPAPESAPYLNTVDAGAPSSFVHSLPETTATGEFTVRWSGRDDSLGSGIGHYDVYVRTDNGPYQPWQSNTTDTVATFVGRNESRHCFYSVATDNVDWEEPAPDSFDTRTFVAGIAPPLYFEPRDSALLVDPTPTLVWSATAGAYGLYGLQYSTDSMFGHSVAVTGLADSTYAIPDTLGLGDSTYFWRVEAISRLGAPSGFRAAHSFIVDATAPAIPVLCEPPDTAVICDSTLTFYWSSTTDTTGSYFFELAADTLFDSLCATALTRDTTYPIPGAYPFEDTTYFWRVQAFDRAGNTRGYQAHPFSFTVRARSSISGSLDYYWAPYPAVASVDLVVSGGIADTLPSDSIGNYVLSDLPLRLDYLVTPEKRSSAREPAVSAFDAALALQHVVRRDTLDSLQFIAGDVSGDSSVSAFDAALVLQYAVGRIRHFPVGARPGGDTVDWTFRPPTRTYDSLLENQVNQDYRGILYGDPSGNWPDTLLGGDMTDVGGAAFFAVNMPSGENPKPEARIPNKARNPNDEIRMGLAAPSPSPQSTATTELRSADGLKSSAVASAESATSVDGRKLTAKTPRRQEYQSVESVKSVEDLVSFPVRVADAKDAVSADMLIRYDARRYTLHAVRLTPETEGFMVAASDRGGNVRIAMAGDRKLSGDLTLLELVFRRTTENTENTENPKVTFSHEATKGTKNNPNVAAEGRRQTPTSPSPQSSPQMGEEADRGSEAAPTNGAVGSKPLADSGQPVADVVWIVLNENAPVALSPAAENTMGERTELPTVFFLNPPRPNPFGSGQSISYGLPVAGEVDLRIFDATGRQVKSLLEGPQAAGRYSVLWNGRDDFGRLAASGIYFVRMQADEFQAQRKVTLLRQ